MTARLRRRSLRKLLINEVTNILKEERETQLMQSSTDVDWAQSRITNPGGMLKELPTYARKYRGSPAMKKLNKGYKAALRLAGQSPDAIDKEAVQNTLDSLAAVLEMSNWKKLVSVLKKKKPAEATKLESLASELVKLVTSLNRAVQNYKQNKTGLGQGQTRRRRENPYETELNREKEEKSKKEEKSSEKT